MNSTTPVKNILYIDSTIALNELCRELKTCQWFALDTEFQREKTYYPVLALIQIATPSITACIDPLSIKDLSAFRELLYNIDILKVLHASGQDLEIFVKLWGKLPTPLFDTQIAAPLLGYPEQISYAKLVESLHGVSLQKAHTRTDWLQRPLTKAQIYYAADDVYYLVFIYQKIHDALQQQNRLGLLNKEFAPLTNIENYRQNPQTAWTKIKAAKKLNAKALAVAQALATWREHRAQTDDLPRAWVLKDRDILDIAKLKPKDIDSLKSLRGLSNKFLDLHGDSLLNIINDETKHQLQVIRDSHKPKALTLEQQALVEILSGYLSLLAARHQLNPARIANQKALAQLALGTPVKQLLGDWQYAHVGQALEALLRGKLALTVKNGELQERVVDELQGAPSD